MVFDVGSLKSPLREGLHALRDAGAQVCSVHPMFGPDTALLSGRHVIFVDLGAPAATAAARALFEPTMATLVEMDLESHDRLIAYVLGLSHALNIAFFTALADSGEAAPRLANLSSTTFDSQLGRRRERRRGESRSVLRDPDAQRLRHRVARRRCCTPSSACVPSCVPDDLEGFRALMTRGRGYLAGRATVTR